MMESLQVALAAMSPAEIVAVLLAVAYLILAAGAVIDHGDGRPVGGVFERRVDGAFAVGIGEDLVDVARCAGGDEGAGRNELEVGDDRVDSVRVGDFGGDGGLLGRGGLFGGVIHLADVGGGVSGEDGVGAAWGGEGFRADRIFGGGIEFEVEGDV